MDNYRGIRLLSKAVGVCGWLFIAYAFADLIFTMRELWADRGESWDVFAFHNFGSLGFSTIFPFIEHCAHGLLLLAFGQVLLWMIDLKGDVAAIRDGGEPIDAPQPPGEEGEEQEEQEDEPEPELVFDSELRNAVSRCGRWLRAWALSEMTTVRGRQGYMRLASRVIGVLGWVFLAVAPVQAGLMVFWYTGMPQEFGNLELISMAIPSALYTLLWTGGFGVLLLALSQVLLWMIGVEDRVAAIAVGAESYDIIEREAEEGPDEGPDANV